MRQELIDLRNKVHAFGLSTKSEFQKIQQGGLNFHHLVTPDLNYKVACTSHRYFFFNWNKDPWGLYTYCAEMLSHFYKICGYDNGFIENTPKDGLVTRIHVVQYPGGGGYMGTHSDPPAHQTTTMLTNLTQFGEDYFSGGLYFVNKAGENVSLEPKLEIGDVAIAHPAIEHGVHPVDPEETLDWASGKGRWMILFGIMPTTG